MPLSIIFLLLLSHFPLFNSLINFLLGNWNRFVWSICEVGFIWRKQQKKKINTHMIAWPSISQMSKWLFVIIVAKIEDKKFSLSPNKTKKKPNLSMFYGQYCLAIGRKRKHPNHQWHQSNEHDIWEKIKVKHTPNMPYQLVFSMWWEKVRCF